MMMLSKVLKPGLTGTFAAVVAAGNVPVAYVFNAVV